MFKTDIQFRGITDNCWVHYHVWNNYDVAMYNMKNSNIMFILEADLQLGL